jgi:hypothetical protein
MILALLTALSLSVGDDPNTTVYNGTSLVDREWSTEGVATAYVPIETKRKNAEFRAQRIHLNSTRVLSLHPGPQWDEGDVWILEKQRNGDVFHSLYAWTGRYSLYNDKLKEDLLTLRIAIGRQFVVREVDRGGLNWNLAKIATDERPLAGVYFDIQLENRRVPTGEIALTPSRFFFAGTAGKEIAQYSTKEAFGGLLRFRGERVDPQSIGFLYGNEILQLKATSIPSSLKEDLAPPGMRWHSMSAENSETQKRWESWRNEIFTLQMLTNREWFISQEGNLFILSLRPGESLFSGVAWILDPGDHNSPIVAWRGTYRISKQSSDKGILALSLRIDQQFIGHPEGAQRRWTVDRKRTGSTDIGTGVNAELLVSDQGLNERTIDVVWLRCFNVDERGMETKDARRRGVKYCEIGKRNELVSSLATDEQVTSDLPPGFKIRLLDVRSPAAKEQNVAKVSTAEYANQLRERGIAHHGAGRLDEALADFRQAFELEPSATVRVWCARIYLRQHKIREWFDEREKILAEYPKDSSNANELAWALSTAPDAKFRDGRRAIKIMLPICKETNGENATYMDTLGSAFAEVGDFKNAEYAQSIAVRYCKAEEKAELEARLKLFLEHRPYRSQNFAEK